MMKHINLLYFTSREKSHYAFIKNLSTLTKSQLYKRKCKTYPCKRCLNSFHTKERLNQHSKYCSNHKSTVINLPKAGSNISFKDFNKSIKHPFVIYADFESIVEKIDSVSPNPNKSYTNKYQKHTPCGFCYYIKSSVGDEYTKLELYRG